MPGDFQACGQDRSNPTTVEPLSHIGGQRYWICGATRYAGRSGLCRQYALAARERSLVTVQGRM